MEVKLEPGTATQEASRTNYLHGCDGMLTLGPGDQAEYYDERQRCWLAVTVLENETYTPANVWTLQYHHRAGDMGQLYCDHNSDRIRRAIQEADATTSPPLNRMGSVVSTEVSPVQCQLQNSELGQLMTDVHTLDTSNQELMNNRKVSYPACATCVPMHASTTAIS